MKCEKCGCRHQDAFCPECGYKDILSGVVVTSEKNYKENPYTNEPCSCGKRGRRILINPESKNSNSYVSCFYCYRKGKDKRFEHAARSSYSNEEIKRSFIIMEHILKPQFYGEEPNYYADVVYHSKKNNIIAPVRSN